jgi:hypothetical protein
MARARRATQSTSGRATRSTTTTRRQSSAATTGATSSSAKDQYTCPECGRTFSRPAALGAHRRRAHGVPGASASAAGSRATRARASATATRATAPRATGTSRDGGSADRDALLAALFPQGIPPRETVIRDVNRWLDEADRLVRMR